MNSGMHAENINQYMVRSKDSVNVSHTVIPLLVVFFFFSNENFYWLVWVPSQTLVAAFSFVLND